MKNPEINEALEKIGFINAVSATKIDLISKSNIAVYPNPVTDGIIQVSAQSKNIDEFESGIISIVNKYKEQWISIKADTSISRSRIKELYKNEKDRFYIEISNFISNYDNIIMKMSCIKNSWMFTIPSDINAINTMFKNIQETILRLFYKNKEIAHFHHDHEIDVRLTKKIIKSEGLSHPEASEFHHHRSKTCEWIELRYTKATHLPEVVRLFELAIKQY
jgi:hypothetical protein